MAIQQDLSGDNYGAVIPITASAMFAPKRDATSGVLTAGLKVVTLTDQTGAAIGTSGNPLFTSGGGSGGSGAPYQATAVASSQMGLAVTTATALTVPATATFAYVSVEGTNVRWRDDGTNPTATVGFIMYAGAAPQLFSGDLAAVKFIQVAATATINVAYYK